MALLETYSVQNMIETGKVAPARWLKHSTNSSKATAMKEIEKSCNNMTCVMTN